MSIVINTNVPALMAAHHVRTTRDGLETAMERLASGSRINSSADDAAGAGISMRLMAQVKGSAMAMRNIEDGISAIQVADGALIEVENMLSRLYELHVQEANSTTYTTTDLANITSEITQLTSEIADIKANTKFNTVALMAADTAVTIAAYADGTTTVLTIPAMDAFAGTDPASTLTHINSVAADRGTLASFMNRLEYKLNNMSILNANTAAAHSRINDTDYAAESANVAKGQVLQQAGAAMLAQANASSQYVLTLLQ
jgi:flagellin